MVRSPATRTLYGDQGSSGPDQEIRILASGSCNDRSLGDVHPLFAALIPPAWQDGRESTRPSRTLLECRFDDVPGCLK